MLHAPALEPGGQILRDVGGSIVRQQPRPVDNRDLIKPAGSQRQIECLGDIAGPHGGAELPGDDETREVVEHAREIVPAPARDFQVGEVGLPKLVGCRGLVPELIRCFDEDVGRAGDQVLRFEQAIDRGLRDEVPGLVREAHGQLAGRQLRLVQRQSDDLALDLFGNAVPHATRPGRAVDESLRPAV